MTDKEFLAGPDMNNIQVKTGILRNRPKDDNEIFLYFLIETESNGSNISGYYEGEVLRLN